MTVELNLLKVLSVRQNQEKYERLLNPKSLSRQTIELLKDYRNYFKTSADDIIDFNKFKEYFFVVLHPNMDEKQVILYKDILDKMQNIPLENLSCTQIITSFEQQEFYEQLHRDLDNNEPISQIISKIGLFSDRLSMLDQTKSEDQDADMDISVALESTDRSKGLRWRLESLNEVIGPLIKSDFVLFSAYVGKGKTSFIASEASHMAEQLEDDRQVIWFNNEGDWKKMLKRAYSSCLNRTEEEIRDNQEKAKDWYLQKMHGKYDRLKIIDVKNKNTKDIETILKRYNPGLIIIDMLDKVRGFEVYLKGENGATERYNQLYAWAEQLSDIAPIIVTSQLNGDGCNEQYPLMTGLRGSRVDKQGNAGTMIIMGALEGDNGQRYLSTPKNKISGNETWRSCVRFDPLRSRFSD